MYILSHIKKILKRSYQSSERSRQLNRKKWVGSEVYLSIWEGVYKSKKVATYHSFCVRGAGRPGGFAEKGTATRNRESDSGSIWGRKSN